MPSNYCLEFQISPETPLYVPEFFFNTFNWLDNSWRNDVCPSFQSEHSELIVYVDYDNVSDRDGGDMTSKYAVKSNRTNQTLFETDDESALINFLGKDNIINEQVFECNR